MIKNLFFTVEVLIATATTQGDFFVKKKKKASTF